MKTGLGLAWGPLVSGCRTIWRGQEMTMQKGRVVIKTRG